LIALIIVPLCAALVAFAIPSRRHRPIVLAVTGVIHLILTFRLRSGDVSPDGWFAVDRLGHLVLGVLSVLFALCSFYAIGYLRSRSERPNRIFTVCLLFFLAMTTAVTLAQHLALVWVAMEGATLSTAMLIYFNQNARSLEAAWKYLMIGSVGIALALLGSLFIGYAAFLGAGGDTSLLFRDLLGSADVLSRPWIRGGFVLLLIGYGTKMGLAPLHTWKPDAYGEAPGIIGALLAGGMTNCAFLALMRIYQITSAAGEGAFARELLIGIGLLSMAVAAVFMVGQRDFKRMLAYSSVEHMGILVLGIGIGGLAVFGTLLHVINNALTKVILFLSAANIHRAFGSKRIEIVSGAIRRLPISGALFLTGFLAITGSPPFGPFISEFTILNASMQSGHFIISMLFLLFLVVIFIGMGATVLSVVQGVPSPESDTGVRDNFWKTAPMFAALVLVLIMGIWIPRSLFSFVEEAARALQEAR
jgi:hydrogenase-4 component F